MELTDTQLEYVSWRGDPDRSGTKADWAREHGVAVETLRRWEKASWYLEALDKRMRELHLGPDKVLEVVHAVQKGAARGDVQAAKLYLQFLERIQPMRQTQDERAVEAMSDEELEAAWSRLS